MVLSKQPATGATRLLSTRTTRLRNWLRHTDPYMLIASLVFVLILLGSAGHSWLQQRARATPAPIIIVATATPLRGGGATHELKAFARMAAAPAPEPTLAAAETPITVLQAAPTAVPSQDGYVAQTDQGPIFVPDNATRVPEGATYTGPFLAPASTPETPSGPRLCMGFHDWRDYDPMYADSPVCHQP